MFKYIVIITKDKGEITGRFFDLAEMNECIDIAIQDNLSFQVFHDVTEEFKYQKGL